MIKRFLSTIAFIAMIFSLTATAMPSGAEFLQISNRSDANVRYVVSTGLGPLQGCLIAGGTFSDPILQLVKDVSFTFYRGSRWTCSGTVVHTAKLSYHAPKTTFTAVGNGAYSIEVHH